MGTIECCSHDQKHYKEPQLIHIKESINKQLERMQKYYEEHPTIKRILRERQVKQQQEMLINKDVFLSKAQSFETNDGIFIGNEDMERGRKNGFGIMICDGGFYYEGQWANGMKQGKGVLANENGQYYCGDWYNDIPYGYGIYCSLQPYAYYKGQWFQGSKHGQGAQHAQDGSKYIGKFVHGQKEGQGKLIYPDRTQYEGDFKSNKPDGIGLYKGKGHSYTGEWKQGKMHGSGRSQWHNQNNQIIGKYFGQYKNGIKQGYGQYTDSKGITYKAMWINGQMNQFAPIDVEKQN